MIRPLYDWVMRSAASRHAPATLAVVSFAESSFFPLPPDVMLAPMILARPDRAYAYAALCTVASVLGGILGYAIGYFATPLATQLLALTGHAEGVDTFQRWYAQYGVWLILAKGVTPIPYKLVTIASGVAHFNFAVFIAASVVTRGARFFLAATLLKRFGPQIMPVVERRLTLVAVGLVALLVLGVVVLRFV